MDVQRCTGGLGAVVGGVRLESIDDGGFRDLHDALMAHQVLFLRDQRLSDEGQLRLAARFGTPSVYPISKHFGGTQALHEIVDSPESPPDADGWHTDITWIPAPPQVAILSALQVPPYGGDTMWADLYGAYDRLSEPMRDALALLRVRHTQGSEFWDRFSRIAGTEHLDELQAAFPGAVHPLVRTHPVTGRQALFVSGLFMDSIVGMHPDESAWLVAWLLARVDDPNLQVRWRWQEGDVAIWDERCTNHRALSDHYPQQRRMRRCTVDGNVPTYVASRAEVEAAAS
jgi:alpha-ketoglutarate-dependent taurine dioxygenase